MTVTVDSSGGHTGDGPALIFYELMLPTLGIPDGTPGVSGKQQLAELANDIEEAYGLGRLGIVTEANATRTLTSADAGKYIRFTNAAGCVVTVNDGVFTAGDSVLMRQVGAGAVSFAGSATVTPPVTNVAVSGQQGATIALVFDTADTADVIGDLQDA